MQRDVAELFGDEAARAMDEDALDFWTYVYFNGGAATGKALLERGGVEGAAA